MSKFLLFVRTLIIEGGPTLVPHALIIDYICKDPTFYFQIRSHSQALPERSSLVAQMVKNLPAMQETQVHTLDQEYSPGERNGNPLQYSCLENPMDRGAWWVTAHGVAKSQT